MIKVHDDHSNNSNSQLCMPIIIILTLLAIGNSCRPCLGDGFRRSHAFPAAELEVFGLSISGRVCDAGPGCDVGDWVSSELKVQVHEPTSG